MAIREYWYNTSYHTALHTTPFTVVYGREPLVLIAYETGLTANYELEKALKERDHMLCEVKYYLQRAQEVMKNNADKKRRDLEFKEGDFVFFKMRRYRQQSVTRRFCQKLSAKYYEPFKVVEKIGKVAYRLLLPSTSTIHPVFHVSLLKPDFGQHNQVSNLP